MLPSDAVPLIVGGCVFDGWTATLDVAAIATAASAAAMATVSAATSKSRERVGQRVR